MMARRDIPSLFRFALISFFSGNLFFIIRQVKTFRLTQSLTYAMARLLWGKVNLLVQVRVDLETTWIKQGTRFWYFYSSISDNPLDSFITKSTDWMPGFCLAFSLIFLVYFCQRKHVFFAQKPFTVTFLFPFQLISSRCMSKT